MRILEIVMNVPYPPNDGGRIGVYRPAEALVRRGHELCFVCLVPRGERVPEEFARTFLVRSMVADLRTRLPGMLFNLLSPVPYTFAKHQPPGFFELVQIAADEFKPDIVLTDSLHVAPFGLAAARRAGVPVVLRAHNVDSVLMARFRDTRRNPLARSYAAIQYHKLVRYEKRFLPLFDRRIAVTSVDAATLSRIAGGVRVDAIPAGVDVEYFCPKSTPEDDRVIISVALMRWTPNIVSTRWFLEKVLPLVRAECPEARFLIVGAEPPESIRAYHDGEKTIVTGLVDDVRPLIAQAAVFVVPTQVGSGIRIKVLEALAMGKAVVSTSIGCEGIEGLVNGENIVIADQAEDFARSVVALMRDPSRRREMGRRGRELICQHYQWDAIASRFEALFEATITEFQARRKSAG
ncbi:MAG: glycosyltransferase family 4 protein [candidate division WOR-3 bacterium]